MHCIDLQLELNVQLATKFISNSKNKELSVIFEKSDDLYTYGHSDTYIYVKVTRDESLHNQIIDVVIESVKYKDTFGKVNRKQSISR